jgi:Na+/melibiose symporter-like transporter
MKKPKPVMLTQIYAALVVVVSLLQVIAALCQRTQQEALIPAAVGLPFLVAFILMIRMRTLWVHILASLLLGITATIKLGLNIYMIKSGMVHPGIFAAEIIIGCLILWLFSTFTFGRASRMYFNRHKKTD